MVARSDIASELMDSLVPEPFTKFVCLLDWQRGLTVDWFRKTREVLSELYWIDTHWYASAKGTVNPQGAYKMFEEFSLTNAGEVRDGLVEWIMDNKEEINENLF